MGIVRSASENLSDLGSEKKSRQNGGKFPKVPTLPPTHYYVSMVSRGPVVVALKDFLWIFFTRKFGEINDPIWRACFSGWVGEKPPAEVKVLRPWACINACISRAGMPCTKVRCDFRDCGDSPWGMGMGWDGGKWWNQWEFLLQKMMGWNRWTHITWRSKANIIFFGLRLHLFFFVRIDNQQFLGGWFF